MMSEQQNVSDYISSFKNARAEIALTVVSGVSIVSARASRGPCAKPEHEVFDLAVAPRLAKYSEKKPPRYASPFRMAPLSCDYILTTLFHRLNELNELLPRELIPGLLHSCSEPIV